MSQSFAFIVIYTLVIIFNSVQNLIMAGKKVTVFTGQQKNPPGKKKNIATFAVETPL
jgi:hypothetical protein